MKIEKQQSYRRQWLKTPLTSAQYHDWLINNGSLTARLQRRYPDFSVKPLTVRYAKAISDEAALLHFPSHKTALIREVLLIGNDEPVVFAHSVLPRASLRGSWRGLGRLGNQPLGAALFMNPRVRRTPLAFRKLSPHHELFKRATKTMQDKPPYLWARRSIFSLNCANILVTEVFLPTLLKETS